MGCCCLISIMMIAKVTRQSHMVYFAAGQIQISSDCNHFLTKVVGGYHTESRGEVLIKVNQCTVISPIFSLASNLNKLSGHWCYGNILVAWICGERSIYNSNSLKWTTSTHSSCFLEATCASFNSQISRCG